MVEMISVIMSSGVDESAGVPLEFLLGLNDSLHKALDDYNHVKKHGPQPKAKPAATTAPAPAPAPKTAAAPASSGGWDDDDFFSAAPARRE